MLSDVICYLFFNSFMLQLGPVMRNRLPDRGRSGACGAAASTKNAPACDMHCCPRVQVCCACRAWPLASAEASVLHRYMNTCFAVLATVRDLRRATALDGDRATHVM